MHRDWRALHPASPTPHRHRVGRPSRRACYAPLRPAHCAAHVITKPLNLTEHPADFAVVSYYKMSGYPAGVGALIIRKDAAAAMAPVRTRSRAGQREA